MTKDQPAFPTTTYQLRKREGGFSQGAAHLAGGLTKRELFAAMAMAGMLGNSKCIQGDKLGGTPENIADWAVDYADALLAELERKEGDNG